MFNPFMWIRARVSDWLFYRAFDRAPVKRLGNGYVKEVKGNLYAVDKPLFIPSDMETIPPK
jgi:hypothetical protein